MRRLAFAVIALAVVLYGTSDHTVARSDTLADMLTGRVTPACPRYQRTQSDPCHIVVHRPGGNPTQDMTGSIGHAKSYQGNGGPRCKTICRFTGRQD